MSGVPPLNFLDAVAGYVRAGSESSADRPIRLATVDPAYSAWDNYPDAPSPPRVTFDGEGTLSTKAYPYANGLIPWAGMRVYMVPIGNTWLIAGQVGASSAQGFWQSPDGLQSGLELGGGSYFDEESGLYLAGDISTTGSLTVSGKITQDNGINPHAPIATFFHTGGTVVTSSAIDAEVGITGWTSGSSTSVTLKAGRLYRFRAKAGVYDGNSTVHVGGIAVRRAIGNLSSQVLAYWQIPTVPGVGGMVPSTLNHDRLVANTLATDQTLIPTLTIKKRVGSSGISLYGDGSGPIALEVYYLGRTADHASATSSATKLT